MHVSMFDEDDRPERDEDPDEAPETPLDEPPPAPVEDPPREPGEDRGPYVVLHRQPPVGVTGGLNPAVFKRRSDRDY